MTQPETETETPPQDAAGVLDGFLSRAELAQELGVSPGTLTDWQTQRRGPPFVKMGRRVLYRREAVRRWLREQEVSHRAPGGAPTMRGTGK